MNQVWQVGIDIGGTFTDVVAVNVTSGELRAAKVPSRPDDPVAAILESLTAVDVDVDGVENLVHGTTRVTNAIVEEKLPPVALITTEGFEDTLVIARLRRRDLYRLDVPPRLPPLVPDERRFGVAERIDHNGAVLRPLDEDSLETVIAKVRASGVSTVAVSLLHSYANAAHEQQIGARLADVVRHVSLSHEVNPEAREYERTSSTVLNAATMPVVVDYLEELLRQVPLDGRFQLFHSAGGWAVPDVVRERPLVMALSGPAAGVAASARLAREVDRRNLLTFDMGGTTTDVCLVVDGQAAITDGREIGDRPLRQPMVAIHSIGAGGGSIVRLTSGGLSVGPDSAGAVPGPACYGQGGDAPTVTDINAILGYLNTDTKLGGEISLDIGLAEASLKPIADELGLGVVETALGVLRVANANMARALRRVTVERGVDGRKCSLLSFGGAGPMHAVGLAREFGIAEVIVPDVSSGFSAYGCLLSDMAYTQQRTVRIPATAWDEARFEEHRREMAAQLRQPLLDHGVAAADIRAEYVGLLRYEGQSDAVPVPFEAPLDVALLGRDFKDTHTELYGYATEEPWIMEGLRVRMSTPSRAAFVEPSFDAVLEPISVSQCWFDAGGTVATPRYNRRAVSPGRTLTGPAIVEDAWSTVIVPPGWRLRADAYGHLYLQEDDA